MPEEILPFYVVCDQSYSMADHLDALNDGLAQLHEGPGAPETGNAMRLTGNSAPIVQLSAFSADSPCRRFTRAQACLTIASAWTIPIGIRSSGPNGKFSIDRCVCAPQ